MRRKSAASNPSISHQASATLTVGAHLNCFGIRHGLHRMCWFVAIPISLCTQPYPPCPLFVYLPKNCRYRFRLVGTAYDQAFCAYSPYANTCAIDVPSKPASSCSKSLTASDGYRVVARSPTFLCDYQHAAVACLTRLTLRVHTRHERLRILEVRKPST